MWGRILQIESPTIWVNGYIIIMVILSLGSYQPYFQQKKHMFQEVLSTTEPSSILQFFYTIRSVDTKPQPESRWSFK